MLQRGLADDHLKAIHVRLAIIQSVLHTYIASSQVISSIKVMYVENLNATKVTRVRIVNLFQLNGMEIQCFSSGISPIPFCGTGFAV